MFTMWEIPSSIMLVGTKNVSAFQLLIKIHCDDFYRNNCPQLTRKLWEKIKMIITIILSSIIAGIVGYVLGMRRMFFHIHNKFENAYMNCKERPANMRFSKIFGLLQERDSANNYH